MLSILYRMTKKYPYKGNERRELEKNRDDKLHKLEVSMDIVPELYSSSHECRDFIQNVLQANPQHRSTIVAAYHHVWILGSP